MSRPATRNFRRFDPAALREKRANRFETQEQVARALDISTRNYHRWENGDCEPRGANVVKLANYFGVDPLDFYEVEVAA